MLKVIVKPIEISRKKLADKNLGISYHDRLAKSNITGSGSMFFQVDCENGYSRFQLYESKHN
jgi:hypothetical protein